MRSAQTSTIVRARCGVELGERAVVTRGEADDLATAGGGRGARPPRRSARGWRGARSRATGTGSRRRPRRSRRPGSPSSVRAATGRAGSRPARAGAFAPAGGTPRRPTRRGTGRAGARARARSLPARAGPASRAAVRPVRRSRRARGRRPAGSTSSRGRARHSSLAPSEARQMRAVAARPLRSWYPAETASTSPAARPRSARATIEPPKPPPVIRAASAPAS